MFLYYDDTVEVGYNQHVVEVDNMMYHVVHDNHWLNLTLHKIAKHVLFPYHLSTEFVQVICFFPSVKHFYLLQAL